MSVRVEVQERQPFTLAAKRVTIRPDQLCEAIGETAAEVGELLGDAAAGRRLIVRYLSWAATAELEIGFEVEEPVQGLEVTRVGGGPAAVALHIGPYDQLAAVTGEVAEWVGAHGELAGAPYEVYLNDPGQVPPDELRTEVVWPIALH
jgi:effector-binding domain-containing protein